MDEQRQSGSRVASATPDDGSIVYGARWAGMADDEDGGSLVIPPDRASLINQPGTSLAETLIDRLVEFGSGLVHVITRRR